MRRVRSETYIKEMRRETWKQSKAIFRSLILKCCKGPILFVILLAISSAFWEAKYRTLHSQLLAEFEEQKELVTRESDGDRADRVKFRLAVAGTETQKYAMALSVSEIINRAHPDSLFITDDAAYFQLIDGYQKDGDVIWSREVVQLKVQGNHGLAAVTAKFPEHLRLRNSPISSDVVLQVFPEIENRSCSSNYLPFSETGKVIAGFQASKVIDEGVTKLKVRIPLRYKKNYRECDPVVFEWAFPPSPR